MGNLKVFVLFLFAFVAAFIAACSPDAEKCAEYRTADAKNACLISLAVEKKDVSVCRQGPSNCFGVMWREFADESICPEIENAQSKDQCYNHIAVIKKDIRLCWQVSAQGLKDSCIYAASRLLRNISSCHEIVNISIKDKCLGIYYENKTVDKCSPISSSELRAECAINIATRERNYGFCDSMIDRPRDNCYKSLATFHGDIEKCRQILNPETRDLCTGLSARDEDDLKLCNGLNEGLKGICVANVAGALGKIGLCNTLESARSSDYCIKDAARILKDGSHCISISNSTIKDECYMDVAIYAKNDDFCSSIASEDSMMMCFDSVNK